MNILLVSQCNKKALDETRRVIDQFAERKGQRTWQTHITLEGLNTLKKMLRQTARRNTAVACHWLKKSGYSELLWVIGRRNAFDDNGNVPTNTSSALLIKNRNEHSWQSAEVIALAASIAGLFHDFGKANILFQRKLKGETTSKSEPFRHEWLSFRLFCAFVGACQDDNQWLSKLLNVSVDDEAQVQKALIKDGMPSTEEESTRFSPLASLPPFAQLVAWLVVSHHRLPLPNKGYDTFDGAEDWLKYFSYKWNSNNFDKGWEPQDIRNVWHFPEGTPIKSSPWRRKASELAKRALACNALDDRSWLKQRFTCHLARLSLMLADHVYSALPADDSKQAWRDKGYDVYANTDKSAKRGKRVLKQKLDEHNIGVAQNALLFARNLPYLRKGLRGIDKHKSFSKRSSDKKYRWQDKAYDLCSGFAKQSAEQGFFGINMASTGCGKTFANARIMYALSGGKACRFSVALGLRALTLQTGDAYRKLLQLAEDDLAVLIGSQAFRDLHNKTNEVEKENRFASHGSESEEDFYEHVYVSYEGESYDGRLKKWLQPSKNLNKLISAPILSCTIDHLIPATDSLRGGKQIAPMLRLLTSDLILDEPDDFGLEDLPGLCRLVNWAGVLGSRVLLSSATMPPSLVCALYEAYCEGRKHFNAVHANESRDLGVRCAWFDEFESEAFSCKDMSAFKQFHGSFVEKRIAKLQANKVVLRRGEIVALDSFVKPQQNDLCATELYAETIHSLVHGLHERFAEKNADGYGVSLGVVRMANINPMVDVAKRLLTRPSQSGYQLHYCVYHSQFPLALRSFIEGRLDASLNRHDPSAIWQQKEIAAAIKGSNAKNHIFIVLATSVAEVGRDHDYDWAIAEPSSLRSLIQLAGRVQRHRQQPPEAPNMIVLSKNIRALNNETPAYCKPGFESKLLPLQSHDLTELITNELDSISALPRIEQPVFSSGDVFNDNARASSFSIQEHRALIRKLFSAVGGCEKAKSADLWWSESKHLDWHGVYIKNTPFRRSEMQEAFTLRWPEDETPLWTERDDSQWPPVWLPRDSECFRAYPPELAEGVSWWFDLSPEAIYSHLAEMFDTSEELASERFGEIRLRAPKEGEASLWHWYPMLGVFQELSV